jgi:hypothetical protein
MTIKFTKTGVGSENKDESLLFEFLDHEVPSNLELEWETTLATSKFANDNQTNQIIGTYLKPITFTGKLYGDYLDSKNRIVRANDRYEQLKRLEKRIIKFWYEGIKQLVVIDELKKDYHSINEIVYTITLQPHDIQFPIEPSKTQQFSDESAFALTTPTSGAKLPTGVNGKIIQEEYIQLNDPTVLTEEDKKKALKQLGKEIKEIDKKGNLEQKIEERRYDEKLRNIIDFKKAKFSTIDKKDDLLRYYKINDVYVGLNQNEELEYKKKLGIK